MLSFGFFDGVFGFVFLDLFGEGVGDVDTEVMTHQEDPREHVGELLAYLFFTIFYIHLYLLLVFPLKMLEHLGSLERERYCAVLGVVELLSVPFITKRSNSLC